jgi:hypothetical protein
MNEGSEKSNQGTIKESRASLRSGRNRINLSSQLPSETISFVLLTGVMIDSIRQLCDP